MQSDTAEDEEAALNPATFASTATSTATPGLVYMSLEQLVDAGMFGHSTEPVVTFCGQPIDLVCIYARIHKRPFWDSNDSKKQWLVLPLADAMAQDAKLHTCEARVYLLDADPTEVQLYGSLTVSSAPSSSSESPPVAGVYRIILSLQRRLIVDDDKATQENRQKQQQSPFSLLVRERPRPVGSAEELAYFQERVKTDALLLQQQALRRASDATLFSPLPVYTASKGGVQQHQQHKQQEQKGPFRPRARGGLLPPQRPDCGRPRKAAIPDQSTPTTPSTGNRSLVDVLTKSRFSAARNTTNAQQHTNE